VRMALPGESCCRRKTPSVEKPEPAGTAWWIADRVARRTPVERSRPVGDLIRAERDARSTA
jgi:hypothetical protein